MGYVWQFWPKRVGNFLAISGSCCFLCEVGDFFYFVYKSDIIDFCGCILCALHLRAFVGAINCQITNNVIVNSVFSSAN